MADRNWNEWLNEKLASDRSETAARLAKAKDDAIARGKERFDLAKFKAVYVASGPPSELALDEQLAEWERRYYLDHTDVMTVEGFARAVEANDVYDGGDT